MRGQRSGYLCVDDVALDLLLGDGDVLQNHLQPHRHHAGHPVHQAGVDVARHAALTNSRRRRVSCLKLLVPLRLTAAGQRSAYP